MSELRDRKTCSSFNDPPGDMLSNTKTGQRPGSAFNHNSTHHIWRHSLTQEMHSEVAIQAILSPLSPSRWLRRSQPFPRRTLASPVAGRRPSGSTWEALKSATATLKESSGLSFLQEKSSVRHPTSTETDQTQMRNTGRDKPGVWMGVGYGFGKIGSSDTEIIEVIFLVSNMV